MKETIKNSNKINILIWMIFIIIPISITILFIYLFAKFIYPMIDSVISTFDVSFTCSLSWIIIILFIPIIFLEILILVFNKINKAGEKKQLYDAILCLIWISELIIIGLLNYILFILHLNSNELLKNYFIMYNIFCIPTGLFLFIKLIYHHCRYILLKNDKFKSC